MPNNRDELSDHNVSLFRTLACDPEQGLGYCCPYALLRVNKDPKLIALRFGISKRTAQRWKAKFIAKEIGCEQQQNCLIPILRSIGK